jgi:hypothetical protein
MSKVDDPLAFMTFPGALCITEPGRLHAPLMLGFVDTPGYNSALAAAVTRLPANARMPLDASLLALYFHIDDEQVCSYQFVVHM